MWACVESKLSVQLCASGVGVQKKTKKKNNARNDEGCLELMEKRREESEVKRRWKKKRVEFLSIQISKSHSEFRFNLFPPFSRKSFWNRIISIFS